jgi:hypothetical protein
MRRCVTWPTAASPAPRFLSSDEGPFGLVIVVSGMIDVVLALAESDCEQLHAGWLAQPANAASTLAFAMVSAWLLLGSRRVSAGRGVLVSGGVAMVGAGVGSLAYHGPQPEWAHLVHDASVLALAGLLAGRTVLLLVTPGTRWMVLVAWRSAAPWIVLAAVAYVAGRSGSPVCRPASLWQPHAAWHILSAVAIGVLLRASVRRSMGCGVTTPTGSVSPVHIPQPRRQRAW